jgi:lysine 2,3-aminomutase
MDSWKNILRQSVTTFSELKKYLNCNNDGIEDVISTYPMRINPYFMDLILKYGKPLRLQAVPDVQELHDPVGHIDPLAEEDLSPVASLVHRYPDRALLLVTNKCAMYCRFCTRKRKVGTDKMVISSHSLNQAYEYLSDNPQIREILVSGGDPFMLDDEKIEKILARLRSISSIDIIRIGTRTASTLPMRITARLADMLREFHPLYINTHFNHPLELTAEAQNSCITLADRGIPLGNHTVLLKGINDDAEILRKLFVGLLKVRVKPYYLFQTDLTCGTNHFRTTTNKGIEIMRELIGHTSGMAIPTYAIDAPGGKGKIPLTPEYILARGDTLSFENYLGETCIYPEAIDSY